MIFEFERLEDALRLVLVNADESGSMQGRLDQNVAAYDAVAAVIGRRADLVILHGFESDSWYDLVISGAARQRLGLEPNRFGGLRVAEHTVNPEAVMSRAREILVARQTGGSTNPGSHPKFLTILAEVLNAAPSVEVELVVVSSSDGGLDGGSKSPTTQQIDTAMRRITSRARCLLAANVLVGSSGSPEALAFFTGDTDRFDNRLLFSTDKAWPGVLRLREFDPASLSLAEGEGDRYTVTPGLVCWRVAGDRLLTWAPEGAAREVPRVTVRRSSPKTGGRRMISRAEVTLVPRDVTLERDGQAVFELIAHCLSDNPYLREASRTALNGLIAPLEALLGTRSAVLAMITASPEAQAQVAQLRARVADNTAAIRAVLAQEELSPRARSSRINLLNNARHLLKAELRAAVERLEQQSLERELGFYTAHPNHWLVWLQPAIDTLKAQLVQTQADPGDVMAHLSTRIRSAKSATDGVSRAADRYLDRILAESRARRDHLDRKADPRDLLPLETPGAWDLPVCPVSGRDLRAGLAAIPFVADRRDLTSGNLMAGGQNVDRMPIDPGQLVSLSAVRELMWGELGQMASPYNVGSSWYNAAIPVLLGPASKARLRDLERAIGWLSTGTSAFNPQMAEAIPGALVMLLGAPSQQADTNPQVTALLRTSALLHHFRSYPYVAGTSTFDETGPKQPLTSVWATSVAGAAGQACLQNMGCITSYFARALVSDAVDPDMVADDLFVWGCRNLARSILSQGARRDGSGGVEGVRRLAAALHHLVELKGFPLEQPEQAAERAEAIPSLGEGGVLEPATIRYVLGPTLAASWRDPAPVPLGLFIDRLNGWLSGLEAQDQAVALGELDDILDRLDRLDRGDPRDAGAPVPTSQPIVRVRPHVGFDDSAALESLVPARISSAVPELSSSLAAIRRVTKAGQTSWLPPADAAVALNPSVVAFLEAHSAFYPLRAWLRLVSAGLVGHPALVAARAQAGAVVVPPVAQVWPRMVAIEGNDTAVVQLLRRAFAFVVQNANGYADNQWVTSPLRTAAPDVVDAVLGPAPVPEAAPRAYVAADVVTFVGGQEWPKMDPDGFLPKIQAIDHLGQPLRPPPVLEPAQLEGADLLVVQRACAVMLADLGQAIPDLILGGLHRGARRILGETPVDLHSLDPDERDRLLREELVPLLAGRVRGDLQHPDAFVDCTYVFHQLLELGGDTRRFVANEPPERIAAEAAALRARLG